MTTIPGDGLPGAAVPPMVCARMGDRVDLFDVRRLPVWLVVGVLVCHVGLSTLINFKLFDRSWLLHLAGVTDGWLSGTLVANLLLLVLMVGIGLCAIGGARPADLGLRARQLPVAIGVTVAMWVLLQIVAGVVAIADDGFAPGKPWLRPHAQLVALVGQLFGNALYEEVLFRGCLTVQIARWLTAPGQRPARRAVVVAVLLSALVFALQHAPNRLAGAGGTVWRDAGEMAIDLALLFVSGIAFAAVYVRTGNLFVAVGLHTLGNLPLVLCRTPEEVPAATLFVVMVLLLVFGPRLRDGRTPAG